MKSFEIYIKAGTAESRPSRGAWIEIARRRRQSARAVASRPSRGAWIEICRAYRAMRENTVAPLAGRVD